MNRIFTFFSFILLLFSATVQAQTHGGFHEHKHINMAAVLAAKPSSLAMGFSSVSEARTIIGDIMDVVDQQQNFEVVSTSQVDNAAAMFYNGKRYILYNPRFINNLNNAANDRWAAISVLAHEIGHHLLGHTLDGRGSQHPKELASDEFSGLVLRRMGASLQQAQLAMALISSPQGSASHPGKNERLNAIAKGWNGTQVRKNDHNDVAIDYPPAGDRRNQPSTNTGRYPSEDRRGYPTGRGGTMGNERNYPQRGGSGYPTTGNQRGQYPQRGGVVTYPQRQATQSLVYRLQFNGNMRQQYFITSQNNVVVLHGNRIQTVAKIAGTNSVQYPYIIYDDRLQLQVDRRGNIYSNGRSVGVITRA
ncbi:hypothetical protein [Aridibaculum aurantiacum]|uniref:hypothetical protein n=1 Tax=Aridibaculum aurantiacum TaxID=2810307 RepID=UPI001A973254|nr:hypothetical protein [Aridibaculum aurantiacum]